MTPIELLKEIEAWLCFNATPNAANTTELRKSIKECLEKHEPKPINYDIEVWAFAEKDTVTGEIEFNTAMGAIDLIDVKMDTGLNLCPQFMQLIYDAISELRPEKAERYYSIKLKHDSQTLALDYPIYEFFEMVEMKVMCGHCYNCGKPVEESEYQAAIDHDQLAFCSQYCFEVANGTPMPVSQGALIFDRIFNQNK